MAKAKPKPPPKSKSVAKKPDGRPSKYQPEFAKQAVKLCRLGATDAELANFFEVSVNTIDNWKKAYPDFLGALKNGKDLADAEVANKLFKRATGYSHKAVKIFNNMGSIVTKDYIERYPPDTTACIFWLKNRQPAKWRDKQEPADDDNDVQPVKVVVEVVDARKPDADA